MSEEIRKVLISKEALEKVSTRDIYGNRLSMEWGEPDEDGFYSPTVTIHYDDNLVRAYRDALVRYGTFTTMVLTSLKKCGIVDIQSINDGIDDNARMN